MAVRVRVPATSANLGPGFDALGLALSLFNEVVLEPADSVTVAIEGEGADRLDRGPGNLVVRGAREVYERVGRRFTGLEVRCVNRIPPGRGLGSSAAAWLGGIVGANALLGEPLDRDALLNLAATQEGHPDNVAAALLGGLTVACWSDGRVVAVSLPVPSEIRWVVLIPELEGSTTEARAVLPSSVPRADAVFNVQRVGLFLGGLQARRPDLLAVAMNDRLHQPYRLGLFPWMEAVSAAAREAGALGCVLSGAGPALLAAVARSPEAVAQAMERALAGAGIRGVARVLEVDRSGTVWEVVQGA
ncbi:MAG: homoserine kinase [Candidatus Rokubacteria bacterium]|nr:homoserine kinase [Candidatus Rokubacteria bacterium]